MTTAFFSFVLPLIVDDTVTPFSFSFGLPIKGTESDVAGIISATSSIKTVRERRTVMPAKEETSQLTVCKNIKSTTIRITEL